MANFKTGFHGPSLVENDVSDLKGNFSGITRLPWKEHSSGSSSTVALTSAVEGTGASNTTADIASYAVTDSLEGTEATHYLRFTDFNFNIPSHATIRAVKARYKCQTVNPVGETSANDSRVYLVVGGSYIDSNDGSMRSSDNWTEGTSAASSINFETRAGDGGTGGETMWGYSTTKLTPSKVNSSSFGVVLAAKLVVSTEASHTDSYPLVEYIKVRVWYDVGDWGSDGKLLSSRILSSWNGAKDYQIIDTRWDGSATPTDDNSPAGGETEKKFDEDQDRHYWCANHSSLNIGDKSFAFSAWINAFDSVTGTHPIVSKVYNIYSSDWYWEYNITLEGTGTGEIRVRLPSADNPASNAPNNLITNTSIVTAADTWYHLVFSYNDTTKEMKIYKNGVLAQSLSFPNGSHSTTQSAFAIGGKHSTSTAYEAATDFANLRIGLVGYWRADQGDALSASDVLFLYNNGVGRFYEALPADIKTNLISYWHLTEASGDAADSHGTNTLTDALPHTTAEDDFVPTRQKSYKLKSTLLTPSIHLGDSGNFDDAATGRS